MCRRLTKRRNFPSYNLQGSSILSCNFQDSNILSCNMQDSKLLSRNLQDSSFLSCNLQDSGFVLCNLQNDSFLRCDLQDSSILSCNLHDRNFLSCNLQDKNFPWCNRNFLTGKLKNVSNAGLNFRKSYLWWFRNLVCGDFIGTNEIETDLFHGSAGLAWGKGLVSLSVSEVLIWWGRETEGLVLIFLSFAVL